ncbi:MAG: hypothetical protein D6767_08590 [Candidatus Hydrogenedentota bacterium]|nr:MAG: hypothetical protein D6767_08590 [Candidatus Hydrogenedentota bacterium]
MIKKWVIAVCITTSLIAQTTNKVKIESRNSKNKIQPNQKAGLQETRKIFIAFIPALNASFLKDQAAGLAFAPEVWLRTHYTVWKTWASLLDVGYSQSWYKTSVGIFRLDYIDSILWAEKFWQVRQIDYFVSLGFRFSYRLSGLLESNSSTLYSIKNHSSDFRYGASLRGGLRAYVQRIVFFSEVNFTYFFSDILKQTNSPVASFQADTAFAISAQMGVGLSI